MGGNYYDRDLYQGPDLYSSVASKVVGIVKKLDKELDPKTYSETRLKCNVKNPLVFALDVTGSMGDWSKVF